MYHLLLLIFYVMDNAYLLKKISKWWMALGDLCNLVQWLENFQICWKMEEVSHDFVHVIFFPFTWRRNLSNILLWLLHFVRHRTQSCLPKLCIRELLSFVPMEDGPHHHFLFMTLRMWQVMGHEMTHIFNLHVAQF